MTIDTNFCCRVHIHGNQRIVAICDRDIVGLTFREGKMNIFVDPGFYYEKEISKDELISLIRTADMMNMVGNRIVEFAVEQGFVDQDCVLLIQGIKHAQIMSF
ncbi:MAG: DUF424 family protein [Candidatus Thermoplasmatota archaeon]|nr:DUF424 family protein [Candidatus Thermoplasmatota archaeon]